MSLPGITGIAGFADTGGDPLFAFVVALLHFDEADGATSFDDIVDATNWTASGNAQADTAQSKWGGASLLLDGTGDLASHGDAAKYTLASSDFCIEMWVRFNGAPGATSQAFASHYNATGNQRAWGFGYSSSTIYLLTNTNGGTSPGNVTTSTAWVPSGNTWYHVAVSKSGTSMRFFVDGALLSTQTHNTGIFDTNANPHIGDFAAGNFMNGWIDDFRMTVGHARYTAAFSAPTGPFPNFAA